MTTLAEVETAVEALPRNDQEALLHFLSARLRKETPNRKPRRVEGAVQPEWPDFEARLRAIYGDKVMPSMVLAERDQSRW
jgi:hypothetical protein